MTSLCVALHRHRCHCREARPGVPSLALSFARGPSVMKIFTVARHPRTLSTSSFTNHTKRLNKPSTSTCNNTFNVLSGRIPDESTAIFFSSTRESNGPVFSDKRPGWSAMSCKNLMQLLSGWKSVGCKTSGLGSAKGRKRK